MYRYFEANGGVDGECAGLHSLIKHEVAARGTVGPDFTGMTPDAIKKDRKWNTKIRKDPNSAGRCLLWLKVRLIQPMNTVI